MWIVIGATMIRTMMVLSVYRSIKTLPMESLKVSQLHGRLCTKWCGLSWYYGYGFPVDKESMYDEHRQLTYNQVIARDEKRFRAADRDGDQKLNREEYADFLHPGKLFLKARTTIHTLIINFIGLAEHHTNIHVIMWGVCVYLLWPLSNNCYSIDKHIPENSKIIASKSYRGFNHRSLTIWYFGLHTHSHNNIIILYIQRRQLTCATLSLKRPCMIWIRTEMEKSPSRNISVSQGFICMEPRRVSPPPRGSVSPTKIYSIVLYFSEPTDLSWSTP